MKRVFWLYMSIVGLGVIIVALPDDDNRVITFTEGHGASLLDVAGLVVMLVPWTIMVIQTVVYWRIVLQKMGRRAVTVLMSGALLGLLFVIASLRAGTDFWAAGAVVSFVSQLILIIAAFRKYKR